ncbi:MAG: 5-hydroxyisourate hydrolase, partial [Leptolyngbya sp. SIO4C1]|nr:5-hydroxyisourate hydrolase [Leptolyngbya sp. SIO4C1]
MSAGKLTTHVLDTAHGCPAADLRIELWFLKSEVEHGLISTTIRIRCGHLHQRLLNFRL